MDLERLCCESMAVCSIDFVDDANDGLFDIVCLWLACLCVMRWVLIRCYRCMREDTVVASFLFNFFLYLVFLG